MLVSSWQQNTLIIISIIIIIIIITTNKLMMMMIIIIIWPIIYIVVMIDVDDRSSVRQPIQRCTWLIGNMSYNRTKIERRSSSPSDLLIS